MILTLVGGPEPVHAQGVPDHMLVTVGDRGSVGALATAIHYVLASEDLGYRRLITRSDGSRRVMVVEEPSGVVRSGDANLTVSALRRLSYLGLDTSAVREFPRFERPDAPRPHPTHGGVSRGNSASILETEEITHSIPRPVLREALLQRAQQLGITIRRTEVTHAQTSGETTKLAFADGGSTEARWIVASESGGERLRRAFGMDTEGAGAGRFRAPGAQALGLATIRGALRQDSITVVGSVWASRALVTPNASRSTELEHYVKKATFAVHPQSVNQPRVSNETPLQRTRRSRRPGVRGLPGIRRH